jgi:hypothetical protein
MYWKDSTLQSVMELDDVFRMKRPIDLAKANRCFAGSTRIIVDEATQHFSALNETGRWGSGVGESLDKVFAPYALSQEEITAFYST